MKRTTLVTGDSGGLGRAIVEAILECDPEDIVVGGSRSVTKNVEELQERFGERFFHRFLDLSQPDSVKTFFKEIAKDFSPITGLVNNSGFAYDDIITNAKYDDLLAMYQINVLSPILLTREFLRGTLRHGLSSSIVNISSVSAHTGYKGLSMYASTKGAMEAFTIGCAREWGERNVRCNCVVPGFMDTNMSAKLTEAQKDRIYKRTSMKRATQEASVAAMVAFLLSDKAISITGDRIPVDCGTI